VVGAGLLQPGADLAEDEVALAVALRVVDALEPVEIEEHDGAEGAVEACLHRQLGKVLECGRTVRQPGERIGAGLHVRGRFGCVQPGGDGGQVAHRLPQRVAQRAGQRSIDLHLARTCAS